MAAKSNAITYFALRQEVLAGKFRPIYVLQGDEAYYIDQMSDLIVNKALSEDERDFNLQIMYGADVRDAKTVVAACRQYPVMAQRRVVVLREAQMAGKAANHSNASELNVLKFYAQKPLQSTILVVCNKGGAMSGKEFADEMKKQGTGVVMTSNKVRDYEMPRVIKEYCTSVNCNIDDKSVRMLSDAIGTDMARMTGEIDKLKLLVGPDNRITPAMIERNIGISKDYNNFELEDALIARNAVKAFTIAEYYERNPKNNPVQVAVSMIFSFFSNVLLVRTSRDQSDAGLMAQTGSKSAFRIRKFKQAAANYSTRACVNIIAYLRECDMKTKGQGSRQDPYELFKELIYKILHA